MKSSYKLFSLGVVFFLSLVSPSFGEMSDLTQISVDTTTDPSGQHATEVDPSQFAFGDTIVSTFQDGELLTNGALKVGFSTSLDGGKTWHHGYIPGTTADYWVQVVTFDLKHHSWIIIMIPEDNTGNPVGMQASRSYDGLTWSKPVTIYAGTGNDFANRPWIACDNSIFSAHFGNCYAAWQEGTDTASTNDISVSKDGGLAWTAPIASPDQAAGSIGAVAIQPNGNMYIIGGYGGVTSDQLYAIESTDGGKTLGQTVNITTQQFNYPAQGYMRADPFPTAGVDFDGTIYIVYADCRFRANCTYSGNIGSANDLVITTSKNGTQWTPVSRIPIDPVTSNVDHFIPGAAVRPSFLSLVGDHSHTGIAVSYYYLSDTNCDPSSATSCQIYAGFISSDDGGKSWNQAVKVFGPMNMTQLTNTEYGYFVANDITAVYVEGQPQAAYSLALPPNPKTGAFNQSIFSAKFKQKAF